MVISMQTVHDTLVAIITSVGVAVAISLAFVAIGAYVERGKARAGRLVRSHAGTVPAQHPTQSDDTRELVLR